MGSNTNEQPDDKATQQSHLVLQIYYVVQSFYGPGPITLGWYDPLEKGRATDSSILAWRILWTEEPAGLQSMGLHSQTQLNN